MLGAGENTIRIAPPLVIDEEQAAFAAQTLETCISEVEKSGRIGNSQGFVSLCSLCPLC